MNNQEGNVAKFVREKKTVLLNDKPYQTTEGIYIPGYIADQHKIASIKDLARPEIAKLFDNDGDGLGDFWPGAAGWGITNIMQVRLKSYGLDKHFKPFIVADGVFKAQLDAAYKKKKGILFYYWTPEWIHSYYDLRLLQEPAFTGYAMDSKKGTPEYNAQGCYNMVDPKTNADWLEKSSITCAQPPATVHVAYSASLTKRAPKVAAFMKRVSLDPKDLNVWILKIAHEKQEPAEVATIWVKENQAKVNAWLGK
jgi:glycine betaine/proline transport system substrate-binding protein